MIEIVNEDGTKLNPPKNPLAEKWARLYPPIPMPQYSQVCDGYSCMFCGRCPRGECWRVPEEDKTIWDNYQKELLDYYQAHNPSFLDVKK